jgi:BirA family biotin operon repressor/biotin-[acetyl-CoA-carboxylase] ligase
VSELKSIDLESCGSTNDELRALAEEGAAHGSYVSSRVQFDGRGREDREWISDDGNLFVSILVREVPTQLWTWVPLASAIAIAEQFSAELEYEVKWPNDLQLDGRKAGGILCESVGRKEGGFIVVGIGLNITSAPEGIDRETVAQSEFYPDADRDSALPRVVLAIIEGAARLAEEGPKWIRESYDQRAFLPAGSAIEWQENGGTISGIVQGLGEYGELKVESEGKVRALMVEEISKVRTQASGG